jgi:hypothetical protein
MEGLLMDAHDLPAFEELRQATERAEERYLIDWIDRHPQTVEQVREGIRYFFESQE